MKLHDSECAICGLTYDGNPETLGNFHFHHHLGIKNLNISSHRGKKVDIEHEAKHYCQLLCCECHTLVHARENRLKTMCEFVSEIKELKGCDNMEIHRGKTEEELG
jgi:hypothetical protein